MIPPFLSNAGDTFQDITDAYYPNNGQPRIPTDAETRKITADVSGMNLTGKLAIGVGSAGLLTNYYIVSHIPYVGPLFSLVGTLVSIGTIIWGYDVKKASENLEVFGTSSTIGRALLSGRNIVNSALNKQDPREQFKLSILEKAVEKTILIQHIFKGVRKSHDS